MVKIVSRKSLGIQKVYDIGVERDHNFILVNGLVASNCFNKSHSTAYGYVTYQTAYLKANYPVEYMAALLTANSGDQDKVQKYLANCVSMGIQVEPPDVNRSEVDFTPSEGKILFGLSAVKNLGEGAIECILQARQEGGEFKCLADLCDRVNLHAVNRRALEALIHCGAFDSIQPNRKQLIQDLPFVIDWAQSRAKDREIGQGNIFDLLGGTMATQEAASKSFEAAPKAPATADYSMSEKLRLEKELLGFYVSDHPLKSARQAAQILTPINLNQLGEQKQKASVSAIVMLTSTKKVITKNGDPMAILQVEDLTGAAEAVVFPKTYSSVSSLLEADAPLIIWGKVDRRDEQTQLIVDDAEPVEQLRMVKLELTPQQANDREQQHRLKAILAEQRGQGEKARVPVIAIISDSNRRAFVRLAPKDWVQDYHAAVNALKAAGFSAFVSPLTAG